MELQRNCYDFLCLDFIILKQSIFDNSLIFSNDLSQFLGEVTN